MLRDDNLTMLAFGPFLVDNVRRTVSKHGVPLRLTLRCIELLLAFLRHPGATLTKQQLLDLAWPDPQASDATLAQHVFLLRRALRHEGREWIRTVPNVGYRFTGEVRTAQAGDDERTRALHSYIENAQRLREIGSERALRSAIDLCTHAIAIDDTRANAYALRASCWRLLAESMHAEPLACLQAAQADADAALERDPSDAAARIETAFSAAMLHRDSVRAQRHLGAVARMHGEHAEVTHARVWCALMGGQREDALRYARVLGGALYASVLYFNGDFGRAAELFDRFAERDAASRVQRGASRLFAGDLQGALHDFHVVYNGEGAASGVNAPSVRHYALGLYIYTLARSGETQKAYRHLRRLQTLSRERYVSPMVKALAYLGLGDMDNAIACVADASRRFDPWAAYVLVDPALHELRAHPRFRDVARSAA